MPTYMQNPAPASFRPSPDDGPEPPRSLDSLEDELAEAIADRDAAQAEIAEINARIATRTHTPEDHGARAAAIQAQKDAEADAAEIRHELGRLQRRADAIRQIVCALVSGGYPIGTSVAEAAKLERRIRKEVEK